MIKQMSLIALGAATLFMAPTVVHATVDDLNNESYAEFTFKGNDKPGGKIQLVSAPMLYFGDVTNPNNLERTDKGNTGGIDDKELKVTNSIPDLDGWSVGVKMQEFKLKDAPDSSDTVQNATLNFIGGSYTSRDVDAGYNNPQHNKNRTISVGTGAILLDATSTDGGKKAGAVGTHTIEYGSSQVVLEVPTDIIDGTYIAKLDWNLEVTPE